MLVENQYQYYRMIFEIAKACPETEEKILESIVEKLCQLDVDIKTKVRKFQFSNVNKIQPLNSFIKELSVKIPTDKDIKNGILFDMLLDYINERIRTLSVSVKTTSIDDFIDS
jgi:hypothetical protein